LNFHFSTKILHYFKENSLLPVMVVFLI